MGTGRSGRRCPQTPWSPTRWAAGLLALLLVPATLAGCAGSGSGAADPPALGAATRDRLAVLVVDDRPSPGRSYRRDEWPHWEDPDGNGCDARRDALVRWSTTRVAIDRSRGCWLEGGSWTSPYDGLTTRRIADIEIDHLVPLAEAFRSGGWRWGAPERLAFANDQRELVAASSASNQAKASATPDEWRPPRRPSWCAYADRWVSVKASYALTVTTAERDALGEMLDTCTPDSEAWPA